MSVNWRNIWESGIVEQLGEDCATLPELAISLSRHLGTPVSDDALGASNRRLRKELGLKPPSAYLQGSASVPLPAVPKGYQIKKISTNCDEQGEVRQQWVQVVQGKEDRISKLMEELPELLKPYKGKSVKIKKPKKTYEDLLCVYPMGDPHFGVYAWAEETGQEFTLELAERNLVTAVDKLVDMAPDAKHALIINLGDFFHTDNSSNRTSRSGNPLDVDGRWAEILKVGIRAMRRCIDRALEKHEDVTVINEIGNHDDHTAFMLSLCLDNYYSNNKRVTIDVSPSKFHWYRFGENMFGVTHGDSVKRDALPGIMAADRKEDWGQTEHRFWYTGHIHHETRKELVGCIVESFRTLAGQDAWHRNSGYRSGQDMHCDVYHRKYGRQGRHTVGIRQIWDEHGEK